MGETYSSGGGSGGGFLAFATSLRSGCGDSCCSSLFVVSITYTNDFNNGGLTVVAATAGGSAAAALFKLVTLKEGKRNESKNLQLEQDRQQFLVGLRVGVLRPKYQVSLKLKVCCKSSEKEIRLTATAGSAAATTAASVAT